MGAVFQIPCYKAFDSLWYSRPYHCQEQFHSVAYTKRRISYVSSKKKGFLELDYIMLYIFINVLWACHVSNEKFMGCLLWGQQSVISRCHNIMKFEPRLYSKMSLNHLLEIKLFTFRRTLLPLTAPRWTIFDFLSWRPIRMYRIVIMDIGITKRRNVETTKRWL